MGWHYYSIFSKKKDQIKISPPRNVIISVCLIAFLSSSGCATSRAIYFTSEPPGSMVNISGKIRGETPCLLKVPIKEQRAVLYLPTGEQHEVSLEDGEMGHDGQVRLRIESAVSTTCRIMAVPFLVAGAAGMWFVEHTSEEDNNDSACSHQKRELGILSIGSFLIGTILYYTSLNLDNTSSYPEPFPHIHIVFSDPNNSKLPEVNL